VRSATVLGCRVDAVGTADAVARIGVALERDQLAMLVGPIQNGRQTRAIECERHDVVVRSLAQRDGLSLRQAALVAGIRSVAAALEARGVYP